jgi:hypothetical protein
MAHDGAISNFSTLRFTPAAWSKMPNVASCATRRARKTPQPPGRLRCFGGQLDGQQKSATSTSIDQQRAPEQQKHRAQGIDEQLDELNLYCHQRCPGRAYERASTVALAASDAIRPPGRTAHSLRSS